VPVTSSPVWNAAQAGLIGNAGAIAASAQVNQLLTTHPDTNVYQGKPILTPNGTGGSLWAYQLSTEDIDQPFTMSGTAIGRVQIPLLAVGDGADLLVSLCADNGSGKPGTMICQTRVPANWITQLSAVSGIPAPASQAPVLQYTGNPLAVAQFNPLWTSAWTLTDYVGPSATANGNSTSATAAQSGNYLLEVGGYDQTASVPVASVFSIGYSGGTTFTSPVPQPSMPTALSLAGVALTADTVIVVGGSTTTSVTGATADVYAAGWNPSTGVVSAWSAQAPLPTALAGTGAAAWTDSSGNEYVYAVGGYSTAAGNAVATVYYAAVANGQITAWSTGPKLPVVTELASVAVVGDFLVVTGGEGSFPYPTATFYAALGAGGVPGPWRPGPALPITSTTCYPAVTADGLVVLGTGSSGSGFPLYVFTLAVDAAGLGPAWMQQSPTIGGFVLGGVGAIQVPAAAFPAGAGQWQVFALEGSQYASSMVSVVPMISVPLPATGLTSGSTYHVLMQQQGGDLTDYLCTSADADVFPGDPTLLTSARDAYAWTAASAGTAVPIQIFDQTAPPAPGILPWHTWADNGARISTLVCATTPDQRLLGLCEATRMGLALNQNQGFESGITPWTVTGGSVAQSGAQAYSGLYSAQITPTGSAATAYLQSEFLQCLPGQSITVEGWFWFTNAVTSNASMSVNWWNQSGPSGYISTSSNNVSVPAGTWTFISNTFTAPTGAYQFTLDPALSGTPAAGQVWYLDGVFATYTWIGPQQSTITAVGYPSVWPGQTWPPLGSTVLA
jgi:Carbohydrate binding domain